MGPITLEVYRQASATLRGLLVRAQHWMLDDAFLRPLTKIAEDAVRSGVSPVFSMDMPGDVIVVEVPTAMYLFEESTPNRINVFLGNDSTFYHIATVRRYEDEIFLTRALLSASAEGQRAAQKGIVVLDFFFSLIAEPRLVRSGKPARPFRRSAQRVLGDRVPIAWHSLSWTVGREVQARTGEGDDSHGVALHVVRAHWRHFPHQTESAVYRRGSKGKGWYVWVKHHFKGHPDFGVKLHHYKPKLGPESDPALRATRANATLAARDQMLADWQKQKES